MSLGCTYDQPARALNPEINVVMHSRISVPSLIPPCPVLSRPLPAVSLPCSVETRSITRPLTSTREYLIAPTIFGSNTCRGERPIANLSREGHRPILLRESDGSTPFLSTVRLKFRSFLIDEKFQTPRCEELLESLGKGRNIRRMRMDVRGSRGRVIFMRILTLSGDARVG